MKTSVEILNNKINDLLRNLGEGLLTPSAYDTAWIARLKNGNVPKYPLFLQWLVDNQLADGSWGASYFEYYQDRILSTLNSIIALKLWDGSADQIKLGEDYINKTVSKLGKDPIKTIGFEFLFPSLVARAKKLNLNIEIPREVLDKFTELRQLKFRNLPLETLFSQKSTLSYIIEFLDTEDEVDVKTLLLHQEENGSIASSPAATAFLLSRTDNSKATAYIDSIVAQYKNYSPTFHRIDIFERTWPLYLLVSLDQAKGLDLDSMVSYLDSAWTAKGVSSSIYFSARNLDDTAVAFKVLSAFDKKKNSEVFTNFFAEGKFFCHPGESRSGISHLAHLISTLSTTGNTKFPLFAEAVKQFIDLLVEPYFDKWHLSKYYALSRINFDIDQTKLNVLTDFVQSSQSKEGGWGSLTNSNVEETAYALLFLTNLKDKTADITATIAKGAKYLEDNWDKQNFPYLWAGKILYEPVNVRSLLVLCTLKFLIEHNYV